MRLRFIKEMNRILLHIAILCFGLLINVNCYSISNDKVEMSASKYLDWESLIIFNKVDTLKQVSKEMLSDKTFKRDHSIEVKLVHLAIDHLNPEALLVFYENNIGFFDTEVDDITPLDYLFDDDFDERILKAEKNPLYPEENLSERLYYTIWTLFGFQPIDENKLLKMRSKLGKYIESSK